MTPYPLSLFSVLLEHKDVLETMGENALKCARPSAARDMARVVMDLAKHKRPNRMWWQLRYEGV